LDRDLGKEQIMAGVAGPGGAPKPITPQQVTRYAVKGNPGIVGLSAFVGDLNVDANGRFGYNQNNPNAFGRYINDCSDRAANIITNPKSILPAVTPWAEMFK
jgi:hypothetical protein